MEAVHHSEPAQWLCKTFLFHNVYSKRKYSRFFSLRPVKGRPGGFRLSKRHSYGVWCGDKRKKTQPSAHNAKSYSFHFGRVIYIQETYILFSFLTDMNIKDGSITYSIHLRGREMISHQQFYRKLFIVAEHPCGTCTRKCKKSKGKSSPCNRP